MTRLTIRINFGEGERLGPGKVALLEAIEATGTITAAAKSLGMSYRRAWLLIEETNTLFRTPAVETAHGGTRGGGAQLTPFGREIVTRYRRIEEALRTGAQRDLLFFERERPA